MSLFVFISAKPEANYSEIPGRSTSHESRESAVTGTEIALHNMSHRDTEHRKIDNTASSSAGDSLEKINSRFKKMQITVEPDNLNSANSNFLLYWGRFLFLL